MNESETTQQQTSFNVLLIGDSCIDEYKIGTVDRLSPEAPVPVIKVVETMSLPGMSENVFRNFTALGIDPDFITNYETITKTRFIDKKSGQHLLRVDNEHSLTPWSGKMPAGPFDAIVISDYDKGFLTYEHIEQVIKTANCPVFIDTKKRDLSRFSADNAYIKINETEYKNRYSIPRNLIITLGDRGAMLKTVHTETLFSTRAVEVMDVCGCGDTFLASLAYQYLQTKSIEDAILFANKAASISVQHRGNYAPNLKEISNLPA